MNKPVFISVWDPLVRLFHWLLVSTIIIGWYTQEEHYRLHLQAGYSVLGLISWRIIWGIVGSKYARFSNFIYSPSNIFSYIKSLFNLHKKRHTKRYIGHNPAGGLMVLVLLFNLLTITISGIALDGAENWSGPMAEMELFLYRDWIQSTHKLSTDSLLILTVLHLSGVIHTSYTHKENLIRAMFSGKKLK